ncbi:hypothetical protein [Pseudoalteromonas luteoviolacea]|uniref:Uncharacterized protein n=1 Tax=Pseudoalteromonas luteoviolacea S4054 TaxID=1129367 RepID=A0A0F6AH22_9GAMM|nr:hypothetical protein [Pseudoalteromonas luteoviolacea]AOT07137.1 hypothetical protein S4054249_04345 [Pseudoalteromonas luteoviolacea]AOT12054.1 hypothetical protein S40542_04345 [Pseudoalteromonas luteoviolacea]AOT16967.1 hypothetical protein S4054_04345 [Pseudoalteromonas luteoviolacea]KKE85448.1 hypothetical protein N479_05440 [Pseudoalteromonas luteoviolacea S4054]KZN73796.1 hypothetical protein N481_11850 [Pseudoalteromonas luteoviolacea S4047-1]
MIVKPQGWVILKFSTPADTFYKIFSSWRGGYLDGDSWRLSSGSLHLPTLSECGNYWVWPQESGSCYHLPVNGEGGYSHFTAQVLGNIILKSGEMDVSIEKVKLSSIFE